MSVMLLSRCSAAAWLLASFLLGFGSPNLSVAQAPGGKGDTSRNEAESARRNAIRIVQSLNETTFYFPFRMAIDMDTGAVSLVSKAVRWEFNLHELKSEMSVENFTPGNAENTVGIIVLSCKETVCIKWGSYGDAPTPYAKSTGVVYLFKRTGTNYGRSTELENQFIQAMQTLVKYYGK